MRKLLCVTAHPDDEAGAFGGTLLLYHDRGVETSVVCLTAGTAARNRGSATTNEELAMLRRAEFAASCKMLGVARVKSSTIPTASCIAPIFIKLWAISCCAFAVYVRR